MTFSVTWIWHIIWATVTALMGVGIFLATHDMPELYLIHNMQHSMPSIVYDECGIEIARFRREARACAAIDHLPEHVTHAFLAAEDHTFFHHAGVSPYSIIRSLVKNITYGRIVQGASTITQQLIKLTFFHGERSFLRKVKEQIRALYLESRCTKQQILQAYLNNIYLGRGIYGAQAGSLCYWSKDIDALSISEAASLAAIVQSPAHYNPIRNPERNQERRDLILHRMYTLGYISNATYHASVNQPVTLAPSEPTKACSGHVIETLRSHLEQIIGTEQLYSGGYRIMTTVNLAMQQHAQDVFQHHIATYRARIPGIDGGLVTLDAENGGIKAMIGGYTFDESQFNRATQARRQMGSIFKPFVYAAAVEHGKRLSDTEVDAPFSLGSTWAPRNVHRKHEGEMTYARALIHSNNVVTSKLFLEVGAHNVIDCAHRCHIPGPMPTYPSLALGCTECSVEEAAAAFNVFAHQGRYVAPHLITWIKDGHGRKIWQYTPAYNSAITPATTGQITHALRQTMAHMQPRMPDIWVPSEAIGKTGTTNNARTCWFVGATPRYTTALYIGRDDNEEPSDTMTSVYQALPMWLACHREWSSSGESFYIDPHLHPRYIHAKTGAPVDPHHPKALLVYEPYRT